MTEIKYKSAPEFDANYWNSDGYGVFSAYFNGHSKYREPGASNAQNTNCYEFAVNSNSYTDPGAENPGQAAGIDIDALVKSGEFSYEEAVIKGAIADGLDAYIGEGLPPEKEGYYPVALYINDIGINPNYHWLRANPDGTWSESAGPNDAKISKDWLGRAIEEPHDSTRASLYGFSMYFYVPEGGITTGDKGRIERVYEKDGFEGVQSFLSELGIVDEQQQKEVFQNAMNANKKNEELAGSMNNYEVDNGLKFSG